MFVNKLFELKSKHVLIGLTLLLTPLLLISVNNRMSSSLLSVDFKVIGKVQGVFFRKFTKQKAKELALRGWCQNARDGSVVGTIQGPKQPIDSMKNWLRTTGSPYSRIDDCLFTNERIIDSYEFNSFEVRH